MATTYATVSDLELEVGGAAALVQLTDYDNDGTGDTGAAQKALDDAAAVVDSYALKKFAIPFDPVPPTIKRVTLRLARFELYERRRITTEPDERGHDLDMQWLRDLSRGVVTPDVIPVPGNSNLNNPTIQSRVQDTTNSERRKLDGFG